MHYSSACPLCENSRLIEYYKDKRRSYYQCKNCTLVFVPPQFHLSSEKEKEIYDLHENDIYDAGYRRFLNRVVQPLSQLLPQGASGLDFGCGHGPALVEMFKKSGFDMEKYDPYYFPDKSVLSRDYDFITATEVIEHLSQPGKEIKFLFSLLNPGGILACMTKLVLDRDAFRSWHYIQDRSHISFFSRKSCAFLAESLEAELQFIDKDVIFFRKREF